MSQADLFRLDGKVAFIPGGSGGIGSTLAAGVCEAIYSLLMMENNFIAASANIEDLDPGAADFPIITERQDDVSLDCVISNSFGFGGTNATLVFKRSDA